MPQDIEFVKNLWTQQGISGFCENEASNDQYQKPAQNLESLSHYITVVNRDISVKLNCKENEYDNDLCIIKGIDNIRKQNAEPQDLSKENHNNLIRKQSAEKQNTEKEYYCGNVTYEEDVNKTKQIVCQSRKPFYICISMIVFIMIIGIVLVVFILKRTIPQDVNNRHMAENVTECIHTEPYTGLNWEKSTGNSTVAVITRTNPLKGINWKKGGRCISITYRDVLENLLSVNNSETIYKFDDVPTSFTIVNGSVWMPLLSSRAILIYADYETRKIKYSFLTPRIVFQSEYNDTFIGCKQGLYVIDNIGEIKYRVYEGRISAISGHQEKLIGYDPRKNYVTLTYRRHNWNKWKFSRHFSATHTTRFHLNKIQIYKNIIYICSFISGYIRTYSIQGEVLRTFSLKHKTGVSVSGIDIFGSILFYISNDASLYIGTSGGSIKSYIIERFSKPKDVVVDVHGNMWALMKNDIKDNYTYVIRKFNGL